MHETLEQLLKTVADRQNAERWGIRTAKDYLSGLSQCFGDCACALTHSKLATPEQWQKALEESAGRLCYSDEQTGVLNKSMFSLPPTPKAALDFACVLTSTRRDRDWDVLESSGAEIDEKMPLLWQHIPMSPIGTLKSVLSKNDHNVQVHFAIADTELGRDAATLVEFGALRMSHGFKPKQAEPMKDGRGFWVRSFECVEGSLVSIPANPDGVVTAYSREKLTHPVVKGWAKSLADARPKSVTVPAGIEQIAKSETPAEQKGTLQTGDTYDLTGNCGCKCGACMGCKGKATTAEVVKQTVADGLKVYTPIEGSWEWISGQLRETLSAYLVGKSLIGRHDYAYIDSMFPGSALVCVDHYPKSKCWKLGWKMDGDKPAWDGDPVEVQVVARMEEVAKHFREHLKFSQLAALLVTKSDAAKLHELECLIDSLDARRKHVRDEELERQLRELLAVQA